MNKGPLKVWAAEPPAPQVTYYQEDLPECCRRVRKQLDATTNMMYTSFVCPSCSTGWKLRSQPRVLELAGYASLQEVEAEDSKGDYYLLYELVIGDMPIADWIEKHVWTKGLWGNYPHSPHGHKLPYMKITVQLFEG